MKIKDIYTIMFLLVTLALFLSCDSQNLSNTNKNETLELEAFHNRTNKVKIIDTASSLIIETCERNKEECKDLIVIDAKTPATEPEMRDGIRTLFLINIRYSHRPKNDSAKEWSDSSSWVKVKEMRDDKIIGESY
jgi:hypothetical protein